MNLKFERYHIYCAQLLCAQYDRKYTLVCLRKKLAFTGKAMIFLKTAGLVMLLQNVASINAFMLVTPNQ